MVSRKLNISDELSLLRMDFLTTLGQYILPEGHWNRPATEDTAEKTIYLTFDDGPAPKVTPKLLELLHSYGVSATFFLIGKHVRKHPQLAREIAKHGHAIGSHSLNHKVMPLLTTKQIEQEIHATNALFNEVIGEPPKLFRPPFGLLDNRAADCIRDAGMKIIYWGSVPEDWLGVGTDRVVHRVLRRMNHGAIIVLHEQAWIADQTLNATEEIIKNAKAKGFTFGALSDLH